MIEISSDFLDRLAHKKNLLAFSAGIDSTALFFLLKENKINFDIAIINHNLRSDSLKELSYAKELSVKFDKKIHIKELEFKTHQNLEARARKYRYEFFDEVVLEYDYDNLLTAHQLDDKLEWFLMQLSKGAGLVELSGLDGASSRYIKDKDFQIQKKYKIIRPLLEISKQTLTQYLHKNDIKYFIDKSNVDMKFKRNYFRQKYSSDFLQEFHSGVVKSFRYLDNDKKIFAKPKILSQNKKYIVFKNKKKHTYRLVDIVFKRYGILLSKAQKDEIQKTKDCVISDSMAVFVDKKFIHIAPYIKQDIPKKIREEYRIQKIPPKIRGYLYSLCEVEKV